MPPTDPLLTLVAPAQGEEPPERVAVVPVLLHVGLALLALVLTAGVIRSRLPGPRDTVVTAKLEGLAANADGIDTLFVGSSLVYRHVDPARFDAATAAAGRPTRSYNLGAPGMGMLELRSVLEQVAKTAPGSLRWVFLDPYGLGLELPDENRESARAIAWHDPASTWDAIQLVRAADLDAEHQWHLIGNHLVAGFFRWGNIGALRLLLERELLGTSESRAGRDEAERVAAERARGPATDGYLSLDDALSSAEAAEREQLLTRRARFREDRRVEFASSVAQAMREGPTDPDAMAPLDGPAEALLQDLARQAQALGARLVLFSGPSPSRAHLLHHARRLGLGVAGLDFADPASHPALFRVDRRFDARHLDAEGARLYTDALAAAFLEQTSEDGAP
jgi:nucleotide-binding universal stress UspA family protein